MYPSAAGINAAAVAAAAARHPVSSDRVELSVLVIEYTSDRSAESSLLRFDR